MRAYLGISVIVAAIILAGVTLARGVIYDPSDPEIAVPTTTAAVVDSFTRSSPEAYPMRLQIPRIGIDASVEQVGIAKSGRMATPRKYADVAWFKLGTIPGDIGNAVIAGHLDNGFGLDAVFKHLDQLAPGDKISILRADGTETHFTVVSSIVYDKDSVPKDLFTAHDGARLVLITCDGTLIKTKDEGLTYNNRRVISAMKSS